MVSLKDKIKAAFAKIGTTNGTAAPATEDPLDAIAHELLVSRDLATLAEARKKKAKTAAVRANLITDQELSVGTQNYNATESYNIVAKTATPREMIDEAKLLSGMIDAGLSATKAAAVITGARKFAKAATTWDVEPRS